MYRNTMYLVNVKLNLLVMEIM